MGGYGGYGGMGMGMLGQQQQQQQVGRPWLYAMEESVNAFGQLTWVLDNTYRALFGTLAAVLGVSDAMSHMKGNVFSVLKSLSVFRLLGRLVNFVRVRILGQSAVQRDAAQFAASSGSSSSAMVAASAIAIGAPAVSSSSWATAAGWGIALVIAWKLLQALVQAAESSGPSSSTAGARSPGGAVATALHSFAGETPDELSFAAGARIAVLERPDSDWWTGRVDGAEKIGWFPAAYVRLERSDRAD
eukprot:c11097_g1_i2.p1 GENE.c11097_g1_i2~~c11097_g1_i2.p1  ORF type:complete len:253 (+),score=33.78 c11097_g1_i2:25-759(+)